MLLNSLPFKSLSLPWVKPETFTGNTKRLLNLASKSIAKSHNNESETSLAEDE